MMMLMSQCICLRNPVEKIVFRLFSIRLDKRLRKTIFHERILNFYRKADIFCLISLERRLFLYEFCVLNFLEPCEIDM